MKSESLYMCPIILENCDIRLKNSFKLGTHTPPPKVYLLEKNHRNSGSISFIIFKTKIVISYLDISKLGMYM